MIFTIKLLGAVMSGAGCSKARIKLFVFMLGPSRRWPDLNSAGQKLSSNILYSLSSMVPLNRNAQTKLRRAIAPRKQSRSMRSYSVTSYHSRSDAKTRESPSKVMTPRETRGNVWQLPTTRKPFSTPAFHQKEQEQ